MGYIKHDAILVTSWNEELFKKAYSKAIIVFGALVSDIVDSQTNRYKTFMVAPDGSKEGWELSDAYDKKREEFVEYLESLSYGDGSSSIDYVWVWYDEDRAKQVKE